MRKLNPLIFFLFFLPFLFSCAVSKNSSPKKEKASTEKTTDAKDGNGINQQSRSLFHDANREKVLGNYSEAEKLFRQLLDIEPANAAALYELSRVVRKLEKEIESIALAEKAVIADPENHWYKLHLAELYEANGKTDKAIELVESLIKQFPDNEEYQQMLAGAYILSGRFNEALKSLDAIEKHFGTNEEVVLQKKELYLRNGKFDKAVAEMEKLRAIAPDNTRYLAILAEMYMDQESYDKALICYRKIQEIDKGDPYIHMALADYYRKTGDNEASFRELQSGFANPRLDIDTKVKILLSFYSIGEQFEEMRSKGLDLANILVATHPRDPKAHSVHADFLSRDKRYAEARDALLKVIALDSSEYIVWEELLRIEIQLKQFLSLLNHADRAIELFPSMPYLYLFKGVAAYNLKDYETAVKTFKTGSSLVVDDPRLKIDFYTYAADAYQELGDFSNSSKYYEKVLRDDPDNVYVLNNYSYFLSLRKENLDKAAQMALKATSLDPGNASYEDTYAWVLYMSSNFEEAKIWLEKAINGKGAMSDVILEHYGDVLYKLGQKEKAIEYWKKAAEQGKGTEFLQQKIENGVLYE